MEDRTNVLVIGSGISGMSCAVRCASFGLDVTLVSPFISERSQSVMAAGGINAVVEGNDEGDTVASHIEDTLKGGGYLAKEEEVRALCERGGEIIEYLKSIGTVFSVNEDGRPAKRAFGGQSHKRTYYCGTSTGKQIVSALVMEVRRYEAAGRIKRRLMSCFHSGLIVDGVCHGALLFDETTRGLTAVYADAVVMATGGQNALFGKTTGSTQCDGYAEGQLFRQGVVLKNLEFIQYHPTTLETAQKRMLISEAARGEGGRLFYVENGHRVYFMEEKYGEKGNLMTRDLISREMYLTKKDVWLDVSFLGEELIRKRIPEVMELCLKYRGIDITKEPIPVAPSVHFFMGGFAVGLHHETNIRNLFAVGECASIYHGANRLGGNSLLAAVCSAFTAAEEIAGRRDNAVHPDFSKYRDEQSDILEKKGKTESRFPVNYIRDLLAETMQNDLGIVRDEKSLGNGIKDVDYYLETADLIKYDNSVMPYFNYSLVGILTLARAVLTSALSRRESRGAHFRSDHPETDRDFAHATLISYDNGAYRTRLEDKGEV